MSDAIDLVALARAALEERGYSTPADMAYREPKLAQGYLDVVAERDIAWRERDREMNIRAEAERRERENGIALANQRDSARAEVEHLKALVDAMQEKK